jgi:hypothetical protein
MVKFLNKRFDMSGMVETLVHCEVTDIDRRLSEIGLSRDKFRTVVTVATTASNDSTPFHPANAAGTFAYQYGTWAIRNEFVGEDWRLDRTDGVEAIRNDDKKVKVIFANVDIACNDIHLPKPRSRKGAGAERACLGNLFGDLPTFALRQPEGWATFYLMVDASGAAELSRPVVKASTFESFIERIYLPFDDLLESEFSSTDVDDSPIDFDPVVARK